jgi:alpha-L-fucosidase
MQERLLDIGRWLEVYGSAIYQTVPCEITHQGDTVFFTQKDKDLYIILTQWPVDDLTVKSISLDESSKITLLGTETELEWYSENNEVNISTSDVTDCSLINEYANVLKVTYFIDKD